MSPHDQTGAESSGAIQLCGDRLTTTSREVALLFGKHHKHVLGAIGQMRESEHPEIAEHLQTNFGLEFFDVPTGMLWPR